MTNHRETSKLKKKVVAIYGGSFNPPHVAHAMAVSYVLATEQADIVWVVPAFIHPSGKKLVDFVWRAEMCRKMFLNERPGRVIVSDVERELDGVSYSLRTVKHLVAKHGEEYDFRFVVGSDCLINKDSWNGDWERINQLAPMVVLGRHGAEVPGIPTILPSISSTDVRKRLQEGDMESAKLLVPGMTLSYIVDKELYGASRTPASMLSKRPI